LLQESKISTPQEEEFRIKSDMMESELQSLRAKIDELENKLGHKVAFNSSSLQILSQVNTSSQLLFPVSGNNNSSQVNDYQRNGL
jgi:hypothetical protein